jgi:hypothetical protein
MLLLLDLEEAFFPKCVSQLGHLEVFLMWSALKFDSEGSTDEFVFLCKIALSIVFAVFCIKI